MLWRTDAASKYNKSPVLLKKQLRRFLYLLAAGLQSNSKFQNLLL